MDRPAFQHRGNFCGPVSQHDIHRVQLCLQQRLHDLFNDRMAAKRQQRFELAHTAGLSRRENDTYDAHGLTSTGHGVNVVPRL